MRKINCNKRNENKQKENRRTKQAHISQLEGTHCHKHSDAGLNTVAIKLTITNKS